MGVTEGGRGGEGEKGEKKPGQGWGQCESRARYGQGCLPVSYTWPGQREAGDDTGRYSSAVGTVALIAHEEIHAHRYMNRHETDLFFLVPGVLVLGQGRVSSARVGTSRGGVGAAFLEPPRCLCPVGAACPFPCCVPTGPPCVGGAAGAGASGVLGPGLRCKRGEPVCGGDWGAGQSLWDDSEQVPPGTDLSEGVSRGPRTVSVSTGR